MNTPYSPSSCSATLFKGSALSNPPKDKSFGNLISFFRRAPKKRNHYKKIGLFLLLPILFAAREPFSEPWGCDAELKAPPTEQMEVKKTGVATRIADSIIRFHQDVLSPVDGPRSSFRPTSSRYMQLAMQRYGFFQGLIMGLDRLLRENDEEWVYQTIEIDGKTYKYDPAWKDKYHGVR